MISDPETQSRDTSQQLENKTHESWVGAYYTGIIAQYDAKLLTLPEVVQKLVADRLELDAKADHDGLIKDFLSNNGFTKNLETELKRCAREETEGVLLALDIDKLKSFNDTLGHVAGDKLIRLYAQVIQENTRALDLHGRLGGDEFGVFLVNCTLERAGEVAERIRETILKTVKEMFPNLGWDQTISIGIAKAQMSDNPESLRIRADRSLYKAKEHRNKVISETDTEILKDIFLS